MNKFESDMNKEKWQKIRSNGFILYALKFGILGVGFLLALINSIYFYFSQYEWDLNKFNFKIYVFNYFSWSFLFYGLLGGLLAGYNWHTNNKKFK